MLHFLCNTDYLLLNVQQSGLNFGVKHSLANFFSSLGSLMLGRYGQIWQIFYILLILKSSYGKWIFTAKMVTIQSINLWH